MTERAHVYPLRVYYEDTDAGGVVYYANYLKFAERARTEMMRSLGFESSTLQDEHGMALAVRRVEADYIAPAKLDDALEVHTSVVDVKGASLIGCQVVRRGNEDLVRFTIKLACMSLSGGAARMPEPLRAAFESLWDKP